MGEAPGRSGAEADTRNAHASLCSFSQIPGKGAFSFPPRAPLSPTRPTAAAALGVGAAPAGGANAAGRARPGPCEGGGPSPARPAAARAAMRPAERSRQETLALRRRRIG